jgi:C-8 sterol isomerase
MGTIFDPDELHEIANAAIGLPTHEIHGAVASALACAHPDHIEPRLDWIFNNAGGAMGQLTLLHASLSEYIILFGTPIGTEGHSGRYQTEVWDFMIAGEAWCYLEGETERTVYKPGDTMYLGASQVKGYRVPDFAWMLEYARGPIPLMLPFGLADTVTSTLDVRTFARTFWNYGRLTVRELMRGKI